MSVDSIKQNIHAFKRKFYLNKLIRGSLISLILFIAIFLIFSSLEGIFWLGQPVRMAFLIVLLAVFSFMLGYGVAIPLSGLLNLRKGLSEEQAAREVGKHFPEVSDKLLNYLQLEKLNKSEASLVNAALQQKTESLKVIPFQQAVNLKPNLKYGLIVGGLIVFLGLVSFINPGFISESSSRIIQFNKEFERPAPFQFIVNENLAAYRNESFDLKVQMEGDYIPENVYLLDNDRRIRLNKTNNNTYTFKYPSISSSKKIQFEASGFNSKTYEIKVYDRPEIREFRIEIDYPAYTKLDDKIVNNTGSLIVPEGSKLTWNLKTSHTDEIFFASENDQEIFELSDNQSFTFSKRIIDPIKYEIKLDNQFGSNKSKIQYELSVINDQPAELAVDFLPDTITYKSILISGNISDDYGFQSLTMYYKPNTDKNYQSASIPINRNQNNQQFFYQWDLDSTMLNGSEGVELFIRVRDNDAINGYKKTDSRKFYFKIPDESALEEIIEKAGGEAEEQFNRSQEKSKELNDKLKELEDRLKNNKQIGWQEEKLLEDIIKDKDQLEKELKDLKKRHEELMRSQKEFGKQSDKLEKKSQQLQELINQTMDQETRKLFEELQKLLKEKAGSKQMLDKISNMRNNEKNIQRELERMKELFKRLQFESKVEQLSNKLEDLGEKQEELARDTEKLEENNKSDSENDEKSEKSDKNNSDKENSEEKNQSENPDQEGDQKDPSNKSESEESENVSKNEEKVLEEQEDIQKSFEELKKDMEEAQKLNQELKRPEPMEDFNEDQQEIDQKLDEIPEDLKQKNFNRAGQKQQNNSEKMQQMSSKLSKMQMSMEMTVMQENIDHLRDILDNLIKLSFEQEELIDDFRSVQQVDPRFIELSQKQLKLIDNSEVIEDSLLSLASRVVQISNFVTREIDQINDHLDKAMNELRERNKGKATSHQQFAMTSMNNLALLLDDVLSNMQMAMAESMGMPKPGQKQGQNSKQNMSQMQQELSEQIMQLKKSGKQGRELSEELARLAAEQAKIRRMLEGEGEKQKGQPKPGEEGSDGKNGKNGSLKEAIEKMEENEIDLVNKRLTQELINRQKEILTRLLEAEESMREQKESPEREGETANETLRRIPPEFEEYLKAKRSEIELLKTIPLDLNPFYKKEVNDYFRRLSGEEK